MTQNTVAESWPNAACGGGGEQAARPLTCSNRPSRKYERRPITKAESHDQVFCTTWNLTPQKQKRSAPFWETPDR